MTHFRLGPTSSDVTAAETRRESSFSVKEAWQYDGTLGTLKTLGQLRSTGGVGALTLWLAWSNSPWWWGGFIASR